MSNAESEQIGGNIYSFIRVKKDKKRQKVEKGIRVEKQACALVNRSGIILIRSRTETLLSQLPLCLALCPKYMPAFGVTVRRVSDHRNDTKTSSKQRVKLGITPGSARQRTRGHNCRNPDRTGSAPHCPDLDRSPHPHPYSSKA